MGGHAAARGNTGGRARGVMLHFAYGANMSRAVMREHAPAAQAVGVATLADYRFRIMAPGHASVAPLRAGIVYGVLWRITPRDCVTLAACENIPADCIMPRCCRCGMPAGGGWRWSIWRGRAGKRCRRRDIWMLRPQPRWSGDCRTFTLAN